ncbi:MAG: triose-phosphate isomerase [Proteobacteria bacterium]|nr:triose-phosphate isomerase [Pseudomonadota bacterium]MBU1741112.1 triose-phosphate isomerase [Pseudomonadota bacterium]
MTRRPLIAANWKMHQTVPEALTFLDHLLADLSGDEEAEVVIAPPFTALEAVGRRLDGTSVQVAAQNVYWEDQGAFTGEVSPLMLKQLGCRYVIIGHSERRQLFGETDETVRRRLRAAGRHELTPILCVGETKEDREAGRTDDVITGQISRALEGLYPDPLRELVVAYEPVWAIGTGLTATVDQAQEAQAHLRLLLARITDKGLANRTRILYGGSVKPENILALMAMPDVDGALVGGASLSADSFTGIIHF